MRQSAVGIYSTNKMMLDGVISTPTGALTKAAAIVVCHPHPMLGGSMDHPIVTAICYQADQMGIASLRFNFRGVESSEGEFSNGENEPEDLQAALRFIQSFPGVARDRVAVVGYSFGAAIVLKSMAQCKTARSFAFIAPPLASVRASIVGTDRRPRLFIVGERDRVSLSVELQREMDAMRPPVQFTEIADADHTLGEHELAVAERVVKFLAQTL